MSQEKSNGRLYTRIHTDKECNRVRTKGNIESEKFQHSQVDGNLMMMMMMMLVVVVVVMVVVGAKMFLQGKPSNR